jgi:SAM-dependent methyltransferase
LPLPVIAPSHPRTSRAIQDAARFYSADLARIHHAAFGGFARRATPGLLALLRRAGLRDGLVVDLGCGSGIWPRVLLRAGYDVLGVDVSPAMIRLARRVAPGGRFVVGSAHRVSLPPCVAVTAIGEGLTYLGAHRRTLDMARLFRRVYRALRPGGLFVFDAVERSASDPMRYHAERAGRGWQLIVDVAEQPACSLLTRRIAIARTVHGRERQTVEEHHLRTFARPELERALRAAGFTVRVRRRYGATPLPPHRFALLARKPSARS